ncbi:hypothetical protein [Legionella shakespearei]|nr:hypothetical protein [Legionella shakespearei]
MALNAVSGCLLALSAGMAYSGTMGPVATSPVKVYVGVFGGAGALSSGDMSQYGTAFFTVAQGGPLAVDSFGRHDSSSMGMVGGHIGFAWPNAILNLPVSPAIELEGFYMGGVKVEGHDINNDTVRLDEHDFLVHYPLKTGVFLVNAVLNANDSLFGNFKPYIGVGIGSAVQSVSGATSIQLSPPEPGLNHYSGNPDDTVVVFAAQPKIGVHYNFGSRASVFAEYRFVYLSEANLTFGSTIAPGHVATTSWSVSMGPQYYNMGTIGIDFDV